MEIEIVGQHNINILIDIIITSTSTLLSRLLKHSMISIIASVGTLLFSIGTFIAQSHARPLTAFSEPLHISPLISL